MNGTAKVTVQAAIGSRELKFTVSVPAGPTRLDELLPLLQILSDNVVAAAEEEGQRRGECVSCKKGCGACCRQLVPISPVEARDVARLVHEMPEPRRSEIQSRFAAARQKLEAAGLWQKLHDRETWPEDGVSKIGLEYFHLGIPCPFLEDESCSIHKERPLTCREYLVTSPAENCANPTPQGIEWLPMPAKVWVAAARCEPTAHSESSDGKPSDGNSSAAAGRFVPWVPLIQALEWAEGHTPPPPHESGPELLRQVLQALSNSGNDLPAAAAN